MVPPTELVPCTVRCPTTVPTASINIVLHSPDLKALTIVDCYVSLAPAAELPSQPSKCLKVSDSPLDTILQSIQLAVQSEIAGALEGQPLLQKHSVDLSQNQVVAGQGLCQLRCKSPLLSPASLAWNQSHQVHWSIMCVSLVQGWHGYLIVGGIPGMAWYAYTISRVPRELVLACQDRI